jgi:hypothetical protein
VNIDIHPSSYLAELGPARRTRWRAIFWPVFAAIGCLTFLWALATPLMAYPDEPAHTVRAAAVVRGQIAIESGTHFGHGVHVLVPSYIANLEPQMCYAFRNDTTAACAPAIPDDSTEAIGVTSAGSYNPLYYAIVGVPSLLLSGAPALFAMRLVSCLLASALYAAATASLATLRRPRWPLLAAAVAFTPMVMFLSIGINPNSLEVAASTTVFCGLLAVFDRSSQPRRMLAPLVTTAVGAAVLANTRSVSLAWLACAVLVAVLFFPARRSLDVLRRRRMWAALVLGATGIVLGLLWIVAALAAPSASGEAPAGIANSAPGIAPYQAFMTMLDRTADFFTQYVGVVGWLDTPMPQAVYMFWSVLLIPLLLLPLVARSRKAAIGYWVALGLLLVMPALIQAALIRSVGYIWQGRYSLPLFIMVCIASGMALRFRPFPASPMSQRIAWIFMCAAAAAHAYSFAYSLKRYVVGLRDYANWQTMITHPEWQPPLTWPVLLLAYVAVLVVCLAACFSYLFSGPPPLALLSRGGFGARLGRRATPLSAADPSLDTDSLATGPGNR